MYVSLVTSDSFTNEYVTHYVCHVWLIHKGVRDSIYVSHVTSDSFTNEFVTHYMCHVLRVTHSHEFVTQYMCHMLRLTLLQMSSRHTICVMCHLWLIHMSSWLNTCVTCYVWLFCKWVRDTLYVSCVTCDWFTNELVTLITCVTCDSFTNEFVTHSQMSSWLITCIMCHVWLIHKWVREIYDSFTNGFVTNSMCHELSQALCLLHSLTLSVSFIFYLGLVQLNHRWVRVPLYVSHVTSDLFINEFVTHYMCHERSQVLCLLHSLTFSVSLILCLGLVWTHSNHREWEKVRECVCEREREREWLCVWVCLYERDMLSNSLSYHTYFCHWEWEKVTEWEGERERERVCVCVCVRVRERDILSTSLSYHTHFCQ